MLELTLMAIIAAMVFYVLHVVGKKSEFDTMSVLFSVIALAAVLQDAEIEQDQLIYFVIPLFYSIVMSALSLFTEWRARK